MGATVTTMHRSTATAVIAAENSSLAGDRVRATNAAGRRLLVVDGQALVRRGFALSLQMARPDAKVLEAASAEQAIDVARGDSDLALVLLDVDGEDGPEVLRSLVDALPEVAVVAVSASEDPARIVDCVVAGARGYVLKSSPSDVLEHVVSLVLADPGYLPLPRAAVAAAPLRAHAAEAPGSETVARQLTERQRDVFRLLQLGQSNKEIARELGVLEGTVKVHVRAIMQKLGVRNRTQVAVMAVRGASFQPD
jgi:DNA-binding NarL/FixJ family response regulator